MKHLAALYLLGIILCFTACKKHNYCPEPPSAQTCDLMQSFNGRTGASQYRKEYDGTGRVIKVVTALYPQYSDDSIALLLHYEGKLVYLTLEQNNMDTVLLATFDANNRLVSFVNKNYREDAEEPQFERAVEFGYNNSKLTSISRQINSDFRLHYLTSYDANGNIIRIYASNDDANAGTFFTYDLTVKATAQFYSDQFGADFLDDQVYLAAFLGWLPDLEAVNRRTSFKQVFNDEDTTDNVPGDIWYQTTLTNHVYDSKGKLISYVADGSTFTNIWHCTDATDPN